MGAKKNTITINGRLYDAATGKPLADHSKPTVIKPVAASDHTHKITVTEVRSTTKVTPRTHQHAATASRQAERAKTLMRHSVKRPAQTTHAGSVAGLVSQPEKIVVHRDGTRKTTRHQTYNKSPQISKFGSRANITKRTADIPVVQAPAHHKPHKSYDIDTTPPAPRVTPSSTPLKELHRDLFETAVQGASSHQAKKYKPRRTPKSFIRLGASALTVALLFAFFAYQNVPNIALKRAAGTIGFSAHIPSYHVAGFALRGPVQYEPGRVTFAFRSNSDNRAYTVTQIASGVSDHDLTSRFLKGKRYESVAINGFSSYIYDGSNMTWTRNGVWYAVEGNSFLSRDQLIHIASSL